MWGGGVIKTRRLEKNAFSRKKGEVNSSEPEVNLIQTREKDKVQEIGARNKQSLRSQRDLGATPRGKETEGIVWGK